MKKNSLIILGTALLLASTLLLSGCGLGAKNLAKQTADAAKQMAELQKKAAEIEEKAAALSPRDRRTFQAELERLGVEGAPEWLFTDEAALLSGAPEETEDEGGGGIGGLLSGIFGGGNSGGGILGGITGMIGGLFGGRTDSALNGTWVSDDDGTGVEGTMIFSNRNWEISLEESPMMKGTFTTSGGNFSLTVTQVHGGHREFSFMREYGLESKWYTRNQFGAAFSSYGTMPDSMLDDIFTTFMTGTYSVSGNKLTLTTDGVSSTFTKIR
jgi:hypothetical protein